MPSAGDLVLYGIGAPAGDVSFLDERGAHAGPSPAEMDTFILHPPSVTLPDAPLTHPVQLYRHFAAYRDGIGSMIVTVASYNIHKAEGMDRRVDLSRIAIVLQEIDADLIGVQEVYRPQAEALAGSLGMRMIMGATRMHEGLPYGNAVFTRLAIQASYTFDLTRPARQPRGGMRLDLRVAGRMLHLFNVHFGLKIRERVEQVEALVREQILNVDWSARAW